MLPYVDHLPSTHSLPDMAFSRGQPTWGEHLADVLESLCSLHDPSTIAAVILEPVAGSAGVLIPPVGYLEKIRSICDKHGILLIFDEVICGFGRTGAAFGTEKFDVSPDMLTVAKGLTNAVVPGGAVIMREKIYNGVMEGPDKGNIELFHGYTYSGHPLSMVAGLATLEVYKEQRLFENAANLASYWEDLLHGLKGLSSNIVDVRNFGLMGAVEFKVAENRMFGARAMDVFDRCFQKGLLARATGQTVALSPPLVSTKEDLSKMIEILSESIVESDREFRN